VGDNPNDITDTKYGNNNVMGPDKEKFFMERTLQELLHRLETTILEERIANNVEILTVRAVPDGDEYDKDIALGIRYAVDNGAK
jgi:hypothetical protein